VRRGEIWWATLPDPDGSGPGFRIPVLIVQADEFNLSGIQTVMVAVITGNTLLARAPGNVMLARRQSGLPKDSIVNVSQVATFDRRVLTEQVSTLPSQLLSAVDAGLRLSLGL